VSEPPDRRRVDATGGRDPLGGEVAAHVADLVGADDKVGQVAEVDGNKLTIDFDKAGRKKVVDSFVARAEKV